MASRPYSTLELVLGDMFYVSRFKYYDGFLGYLMAESSEQQRFLIFLVCPNVRLLILIVGIVLSYFIFRAFFPGCSSVPVFNLLLFLSFVFD